MDKINLIVTNKTKTGGIHLSLKTENDDLGILYSTKEQYNKFLNLLREGCFQSGVELNLNDPALEEDDAYDNSLFFL